MIKAEDNLRSTLAVDQNWLLSNLARQEGGIKFLIDIRADILVLIQELHYNLNFRIIRRFILGSNRVGRNKCGSFQVTEQCNP